MSYRSLLDCINDLEDNNQILKIKQEVDPDLDMASIHIDEFQNRSNVIFFEKVIGSKYAAVSNIFGTYERSRFIFRTSIDHVKSLIDLKSNPRLFLEKPFSAFFSLLYGIYSVPKKVKFPISFKEVHIEDLPQIRCWEKDGGSFITLPQVYTEDIENPGIKNSNLGMYRIQLCGNDYKLNKEVGMHYQLHRGIGIHQKKAHDQGKPLRVSIFIGGPPSHTLSAIMPLPEKMSELEFAGILGKRRFRYAKKDGYTISADADFVICGKIYPEELKPEGPFGDHLGYYSLKHDFPVLRVEKVFAKENGIWPFTVVGRPPQEDSQFGSLIHELTGNAVKSEIPGLHSINAVDDAGVHPLLLAIGSERYTPYNSIKKPQELLTIANHILGTGQLSLCKYLFICDNKSLDINDEESFFTYFLSIVDWNRDLHFQTKTTMDTLDYSGDRLNEGSKVVIAAVGKTKRILVDALESIVLPKDFSNQNFISKGNLVLQGKGDINDLISCLEQQDLEGVSLITLVDDADFVSQNFSNWLWVTFTRSNPANDIYGLHSETKEKHFSCSIPLIDARIKEHHAPILER